MSPRVKNFAVLVAAVLSVFGVTAAIGLKLVPEPRTDTDYLVIGSIATLLALAALFGVLFLTIFKSSEPLIRRRPRTTPGQNQPPD